MSAVSKNLETDESLGWSSCTSSGKYLDKVERTDSDISEKIFVICCWFKYDVNPDSSEIMLANSQ